MQIINVIEIVDGVPCSVKSFPILSTHNTEEQDAQVDKAEDLFRKLAGKNGFEGAASDILDDGYWESANYTVALCWSDVNL